MYFPSAYFRAKARAALKGRWQTALLIALIVSLPVLISQLAFKVLTGNEPSDQLYVIYRSAIVNDVLSEQLLMQGIRDYFYSTGFWASVGISVGAWLVTPCLSLGMYRWMLDRLRGQADEPVSTVFCHVRLFFKAIGLQLLIILKVLLWMLPGVAAVAAAYLPLFRAGNTPASVNAAMKLTSGLMLPAMLIMAVPGVMAALRYAMSEFILADEPDTRIAECIRRSKKHMREMKRMLFSLLLSFLLWYLLGMIASAYLSFGSGALSLMLQMLIVLVLTVYMNASEAAFYLETAPGRIPKQKPADEPGPDDGAEPLN